MAVELETINPDKIIKLMFNQLSRNNSGIKEESSKVYTEEEMKKKFPELDEVMKDLKKITESDIVLNRKVKLSLNKEINRVIITIVEKDTDRVIKEIPCREIQDLAMHLKKALGILYDNNA